MMGSSSRLRWWLHRCIRCKNLSNFLFDHVPSVVCHEVSIKLLKGRKAMMVGREKRKGTSMKFNCEKLLPNQGAKESELRNQRRLGLPNLIAQLMLMVVSVETRECRQRMTLLTGGQAHFEVTDLVPSPFSLIRSELPQLLSPWLCKYTHSVSQLQPISPTVSFSRSDSATFQSLLFSIPLSKDLLSLQSITSIIHFLA